MGTDGAATALSAEVEDVITADRTEALWDVRAVFVPVDVLVGLLLMGIPAVLVDAQVEHLGGVRVVNVPVVVHRVDVRAAKAGPAVATDILVVAGIPAAVDIPVAVGNTTRPGGAPVSDL